MIAASPSTGVNTLTGEGLAEALAGAQVVVDVANSPSFEDTAVLEFFETGGRNLLAAEAAAGVGHHDPQTMPERLARAHTSLDRAVDRYYRPEPFRSERERVEHLFARYEALIRPLLPVPSRARRRRT